MAKLVTGLAEIDRNMGSWASRPQICILHAAIHLSFDMGPNSFKTRAAACITKEPPYSPLMTYVARAPLDNDTCTFKDLISMQASQSGTTVVQAPVPS